MNTYTRLSLAVLLTTGSWQLSAQTASVKTEPANPPAPAAAQDEELVILSPFEVSTEKDTGYQATNTLAGTRIRTELKDVSASVSVYTKGLLNDIGATDNGTLLQYTTNAEVAGTRGTYAGLGNTSVLDESGSLRQPSSNQRMRGLAPADGARDYFISDIPWDGFNIDRVEALRGPNSILYGLGSPAGIINGSTHSAEFRDMGEVTSRFGSYGSLRSTLDYNKQLIPGVLAVRGDVVWNNQKFEQKQAWQQDKRYFGAVRFDPQLFDRKDFHTSIRAKAEKGDISADRPRIIPPYDSLTAWFRPVDNSSLLGGMGKMTVTNPYDPWATKNVVAGDGRNLLSSSSVNYQPWLSDKANAQQPYWLIDGTTNRTYAVNGGFINNGALYQDGGFTGVSNGINGKVNAGQFYGLTDLKSYVTNAHLMNSSYFPDSKYGQYRAMVLQDSSVFDFYKNLIDGPTKWEAENWTAYNVDFSQTAWDGRLGIDLIYDVQNYKRGSEALLGGSPTLSIDILQNFADYYLQGVSGRQAKPTNANFGRAYVQGAGNNGGTTNEIDRKNFRASVFGEFRTSDVTQNALLVRIFGKQVFNGVYASEKMFTENRNWQMYANSQAWDGYWNGNDGSTSGVDNRPPLAFIYLGSAINGRTSASGAHIPGITSNVTLQDSGVYVFDTTWKNYSVTPNAAWDTTSASAQQYAVMFDNFNTIPSNKAGTQYTAWGQNSNPANYVGWNSNFQDNLLRYNKGQDLSLLRLAQMAERVTTSYSGSWQGYLWDAAIVPTLGWRYDKIDTRDVTASRNTLSRNTLNLDPNVYRLPDSQITIGGHSTSGGVVVHFNKILKHDYLPINVSAGYNESSNFQVTGVRRDVYGNQIGNPSGNTREYSVQLSTKDEKYSFRFVKFTTKSFNSQSTLGDSGTLGSTVAAGLAWRNVFLYQLGGYDWASRGQQSYRNTWTNAYPLNDPASATYDASKPAFTQANADAEMDAAITGWNNIQKHLEGKGFFKAWNFTPTTSSVLVDRTTYLANPSAYVPDAATLANYGATQPQGFAVTSDTVSKGYEFELTANPLQNWRVTFNASKTTATQSNLGGQTLNDYVTYLSSQLMNADGTPTAAGKVPRWGGASNAIYPAIWSPWLGNYTLLQLQQGASMPEVRKWRYNIITNYDIKWSFLKGVGVGAAYRWQDKQAIGYPVIPGSGATANYDLAHPYYGPSEDGFDAWVSYTHKVTSKIDWKIQLNVYNIGKKDKLIPIAIEPDGKTWASARIAPVQEWYVTNTFSF